MQATFFVTRGFVGESEDDREGNWMVWDPEINTLYSTGFPIESHSVTHPRLTDVSLLQAWHELVDSRLDIEAHLGNQVADALHRHPIEGSCRVVLGIVIVNQRATQVKYHCFNCHGCFAIQGRGRRVYPEGRSGCRSGRGG